MTVINSRIRLDDNHGEIVNNEESIKFRPFNPEYERAYDRKRDKGQG